MKSGEKRKVHWFQSEGVLEKLYRAGISGKAKPQKLIKELNKLQDEVMEDYYESPKCGEDDLEKSWEVELLCLLEQIKHGFNVSLYSMVNASFSFVNRKEITDQWCRNPGEWGIYPPR